MKQFPKNGSGQMKFDPSAYVELQMAQLIRAYSTAEGKQIPARNLYSHLANFVFLGWAQSEKTFA
jgi:hypothetical protein